MKIRGYFIAASLCALSISSLSAQADADFAKANRDFAQGHFKGAIFAIWQVERGSKGNALAIVTGKDVQARLATADTANAVLALPPGSEVKILSTRGDWT